MSAAGPGERPPGPGEPGPEPVRDEIPAAAEKPWERPSARNRRILATASMLALAATAFLTGLFIFNNLVMPRVVHSVNEQRVPDLTHLTVEQAEKLLRGRELLLSRAGERFDPSVPRGFILSQEPPPETPIRRRKRVMVVVSLGEEFSSVPELFGESVRTARLLLERAGLRVGGLTRAYSEEVGEGLVVASDPPAETVLAHGTPVSLLLSIGRGEESFVMPELIGREIGGARRQLEAFGFRVVTPPAAPSVGPIIYQEPPSGSLITRQTQIVLQATGRVIR
jgi:serine/threonine-protein kinase